MKNKILEPNYLVEYKFDLNNAFKKLDKKLYEHQRVLYWANLLTCYNPSKHVLFVDRITNEKLNNLKLNIRNKILKILAEKKLDYKKENIIKIKISGVNSNIIMKKNEFKEYNLNLIKRKANDFMNYNIKILDTYFEYKNINIKSIIFLVHEKEIVTKLF